MEHTPVAMEQVSSTDEPPVPLSVDLEVGLEEKEREKGEEERSVNEYSGTSEERTLWERPFCPLFGGCPLLGGCLIFALYPP